MPPSTGIDAADNHFLPPSDDNYDNDADPVDLMGKYVGRGKKKGEGGHRHMYRDDNDIKALHGLYKEPKYDNDDGRDNDNNGDCNWEDMEEKKQEQDADDDDDVVNITAVQLFGIPEELFLGKETENKKKKKKKEE